MTDYVTAVTADSSTTSHPIVRPVNSPSERAYTSAIVYQKVSLIIHYIPDELNFGHFSKGASVLRMLEFVMGSDNFVSALKNYLRKYEYQTVVTQQLWDELNLTFPKVCL